VFAERVGGWVGRQERGRGGEGRGQALGGGGVVSGVNCNSDHGRQVYMCVWSGNADALVHHRSLTITTSGQQSQGREGELLQALQALVCTEWCVSEWGEGKCVWCLGGGG